MSTADDEETPRSNPPENKEEKTTPEKRKTSDHIWVDDYGKPLEHDPNFRGPLKDRSCTDVICGFALLLFLAAWGGVAFFAIKWGNPEILLHPSDSKSRICGTSNMKKNYNLSDKPYLMFFDLAKCVSYATVFEGCPTPQVCVAKCPGEYFSYVQLKDELLGQFGLSFQDGLKKYKKNIFCIEEFDKTSLKTFDDLKRAVDQVKCAAYTIESSPVVGRCVPKLLTEAGKALVDIAAEKTNNLTSAGAEEGQIANATSISNSESFVKLMLGAMAIGEKILADLHWSAWQILVFLIISGFLAFIWIVLMRWIAPIMVWLSIVLVVLLLALGTAVCWWKYISLKNHDGQDWRFTINIQSYLQMTNTWLVCSIIVTVVFVTIVLLLLFLRSRIQVAIAMIKESSKALMHIISALFFPLFPFILQLLVFSFFLAVAVHLSAWAVPNCRRVGILTNSSNFTSSPLSSDQQEMSTNGTKCDCDDIGKPEEPYCIFVNYTHLSLVGWLQAANLFGLFWMVFFIDALGQMTLAGAFASYYWAFRKPDDIPALPLLTGFWRAIRYHLGSIAFGSLILAIVRLIRVVLEYIDNKLKGTENPVAEFFTKCLKCCFWCLEKFIKFLNKNAYIMIAIYGNNFCKSAKDAFLLLMRNVVRVFVLDKLTDFLLFLGKLVITVGAGVFSYFYFSGFWKFNDILVNQLNFYFVPVIIVTVGTYLICCAFFGVYEMAVDTTFLCFLEDSERNDGSADKPYFMSKNLMKILNKRNYFHREKVKNDTE